MMPLAASLLAAPGVLVTGADAALQEGLGLTRRCSSSGTEPLPASTVDLERRRMLLGLSLGRF